MMLTERQREVLNSFSYAQVFLEKRLEQKPNLLVFTKPNISL